MTSREISASDSFSEFYLNEKIAGHFFLRPSIFVGNSYQRIFADNPEKGCDAVIEVITRIALFIILPIIAILSSLLIPLGLICKAVGNCCSPSLDSVKEPTPRKIPNPKRPVTKPKEPVRPTRPSPTKPKEPPQPSPPKEPPRLSPPEPPQPVKPKEPPKPPSALEQKIQKATEIFTDVEKALGKVEFRKIDIAIVASAKKLLEQEAIKTLLCEVPSKDSTDDPLNAFTEKYQILSTRIESLEFHYDFYSQTLSGDGEIKVTDNGDCLFAAFVKHEVLKNPDVSWDIKAATQKERSETVEWIRTHYDDDKEKELQSHLVNSLAEHYHTKIEQLEKELEDMRRLLTTQLHSLGELGTEQALKRQEEIPQEMARLYTEIIPKISAAFGKAHSDQIQFDAVKELVPDYLKEMSGQGIHGGAAELYVLSCRHLVCANVHKKEGDKVAEKPYKVINAHLESPKNAALHFSHSRNHYNPYFPPASDK